MRVSQGEHGRTYIQGGMATTETLRSRIRCSGMQLGERRERDRQIPWYWCWCWAGAGCWATPSARVLFCSVPGPGLDLAREKTPLSCTHACPGCPGCLGTAPMGTRGHFHFSFSFSGGGREEWSSGQVVEWSHYLPYHYHYRSGTPGLASSLHPVVGRETPGCILIGSAALSCSTTAASAEFHWPIRAPSLALGNPLRSMLLVGR